MSVKLHIVRGVLYGVLQCPKYITSIYNNYIRSIYQVYDKYSKTAYLFYIK
jgi:hypothetical protein